VPSLAYPSAIAAYLIEPGQHDGLSTGLAREVRLKRTGNTLTEAG
jgi:hypothetical protein